MKTVALAEVAEFIMGQAPPGEDCNREGVGTPFVKAGEFDRDRPIIREWTTQPLKFATANDVLVCVVGATAGKLNLGVDCAIGRSVGAIRPIKTELNQLYLYSYLKLWVGRLRAGSQGSAQGVITRDMLGAIPIPLPDLDEQERIAKILDKAAAIRRKREHGNELADEFLRSLFLDMFGDPVRNPKGWPLAMFADILELPLRNGISPSTDGTYPARVLTLSAITGGTFNPLASKIALFVEPTRPEKLVDSRDFLICRGNGNLTLVGKGKFPTLLADTAFPDTVIAARIGALCEKHYLQSLWDTQCIRKQIEQGARTTNGTFKVNQQMLEKIELPLPPLRLQQRFERIAVTLANLKSRLDRAATMKSTLQSALAQRAFCGEL